MSENMYCPEIGCPKKATKNMGQNIKKSEKKLELRQRRIFSEEFKRQKVQMLIEKKISIKELSELYKITRMTAYRWLHKYSPHHQKGTVQIVQMSSEMEKTKQLQKQLAQTEQIVGQKQIYIDYLERLIAIASEELKVDIKKNFDTQSSNGTGKIQPKTPTK